MFAQNIVIKRYAIKR